MSWSGPVANAPPFQQAPYGNHQSAYGQQPPHQYGQPSQQSGYGQYPPESSWSAAGHPKRASNNRQPKKKGNPVITRYPPPPGYQGPAQPQGPFSTNRFPGQYQPEYTHGPQVHPNYPQQGYATAYGHQASGHPAPQASSYTPPAYSPAQAHPWPQSSYTHTQGYSQPPMPSAVQGFVPPHAIHNGYPPQPAAMDSNQQAFSQMGSWPSKNRQAHTPAHRRRFAAQSVSMHTIDLNVTPRPAAVHMATSQACSASNRSTSAMGQISPREKTQMLLSCDDWDFDFEGAIWPKGNEPVDPNLSLGVIIWHPAKQMTRALPSTFSDAEAQSLEAMPEELGNGDSVSMYFTAENSHEAFLDVRQTDDWWEIRDDPVFVVFTDERMQDNLVSIEDCIAQRDRPDDTSDITSQDKDHEMQDATWDIMENLEQALTSKNRDSQSQSVNPHGEASVMPTQEDILAKLGVTGSPKPPSQEPLPSSHRRHEAQSPISHTEKPLSVEVQPDPPRASLYTNFQNPNHGPTTQRLYGPMSSSVSRPPPPPPPQEQSRYDPWNAPQRNETDSPAPSEGSNRTMVGSDFESAKPDNSHEHDINGHNTLIAPDLQRRDSSFNRKRSYEDADKDGEELQHHDDHSKRKRRSQVDAVYSRR